MLILWPLAFIVLSIYYEWEDFQSYTKILIEIYIQCNDNIYFYSLYFLTQQLLSCNNVIVYVGETQKFSNTIFMLFLIYKIIYYYVLATAFFVWASWTLLLAQLFLFFSAFLQLLLLTKKVKVHKRNITSIMKLDTKSTSRFLGYLK